MADSAAMKSVDELMNLTNEEWIEVQFKKLQFSDPTVYNVYRTLTEGDFDEMLVVKAVAILQNEKIKQLEKLLMEHMKKMYYESRVPSIIIPKS